MRWLSGRIASVLVTAAVVAGLTGARASAKPVVLFDEGHGERFLVGATGPLDLSALGALFRDQGWEVRTGRAALADDVLAAVDAIVLSGAFVPLVPDEIDAVVRFLDRGGRLCVMLHIGPPVDRLLYRLDTAISNGVIRERENVLEGDPLNFRVTRLASHPLLRGVGAFAVFGAWALQSLGSNPEILARTSPGAWVDLNRDGALGGGDATQSFGVAVAGVRGKGRFAVFGDDAMFQNRFLSGGNLTLGKNLVAWLAGAPSAAGDAGRQAAAPARCAPGPLALGPVRR